LLIQYIYHLRGTGLNHGDRAEPCSNVEPGYRFDNDYVFLGNVYRFEVVRKDEKFRISTFFVIVLKHCAAPYICSTVSRNGSHYHPAFCATKAAEMD